MVTSTALTCYIRDLNTGTRVDFNIEKPESVNDSYSANFEPQSVKGRSSPFQSYANSGPRTISFSIKLSLDYNRDIREIVDSIRMMLKPFKSEGVLS